MKAGHSVAWFGGSLACLVAMLAAQWGFTGLAQADNQGGALHDGTQPMARARDVRRLVGRDLTTFALVQGLSGRGALGEVSPFAPGTRRAVLPLNGALCRDGMAGGEGRDFNGGKVHSARCSLLPEPAPSTPGSTSGTGTSTGPTPVPNPQDSGDKPGFAYHPPGNLAARDKERGRQGDRRVYVPNMIFPLKLGAGLYPHLNSQIWGYGGGGWNGVGEAGGSENDPRNYDPMNQRDNFCEVRGWSMPLCPAGAGHQGQDIRPPSYKDNHWEAVAVVDGTITSVTSNTTVILKGADGTEYQYLHMHPRSIQVAVGAKVSQGDVLGRVSKYMGGTVSTSLHLHFNVRQRIKVGEEVMQVYVPTYTSLIAALRRAKGLDAGIDSEGLLIADGRVEIGAPMPAPVPTPAPLPEPEDPDQQPDPAPAPVPPQPAPTPAPQPAPTPAPQPAPTPAPQPAPTPAPQPAPTPAPQPAPTPAPQPVPAPPAPAPTPQPGPEPAPQPQPAPAPEKPAGWLDWAYGGAKSWWDWAWKKN